MPVNAILAIDQNTIQYGDMALFLIYQHWQFQFMVVISTANLYQD